MQGCSNLPKIESHAPEVVYIFDDQKEISITEEIKNEDIPSIIHTTDIIRGEEYDTVIQTLRMQDTDHIMQSEQRIYHDRPTDTPSADSHNASEPNQTLNEYDYLLRASILSTKQKVWVNVLSMQAI